MTTRPSPTTPAKLLALLAPALVVALTVSCSGDTYGEGSTASNQGDSGPPSVESPDGGPATPADGGPVSGVSCAPSAAACVDAKHAGVCNGAGDGWTSTTECAGTSTCDVDACVGPIAWHLRQSVDLQFVNGRDVSELDHCAATSAEDIAANRLLCDAFHVIARLQPRFGHFYGSAWARLDPMATGCAGAPDVASMAECTALRMKKVVARFHAVAPHMMLSGMIAEYVPRSNVPAADWPAICRAGTLGTFGADTCVPDLEHSDKARDYAYAWGKSYIDAGLRAILFGEVRLMTGREAGSSNVPAGGAAGLQLLITRLKSYAASKGIVPLYIGLQNARSARVGNVELADFVAGAMHLEVVGPWLLQPLNESGPFLHGIYAATDAHDASLSNNTNALPVLLDYDNWSGNGAQVDDIRNFGMVADNATRARIFQDHFEHLRAYSPDVSLSVPLSKTTGDLGTTCHGVSGSQFAASACGLVDVASALFAAPEPTRFTAGGNAADPPIRRSYWGQQLRGRDETASWLYRSLLGRPVTPSEYATRVASMPALIDSGAGARLALGLALLASPEFAAQKLDNAAFVTAVYRAFLLIEPDPAGLAYWSNLLASKSRAAVMTLVANSAEATSLYAP